MQLNKWMSANSWTPVFPMEPTTPEEKSKYYLYNKNWWLNKTFNVAGVDCNGNMGPGKFCYCPSQGFSCACKPNPNKELKWMCWDHYGYDCNGNFVDGEDSWCTASGNRWTKFNQKLLMNL